jgi:hypothetical protein
MHPPRLDLTDRLVSTVYATTSFSPPLRAS